MINSSSSKAIVTIEANDNANGMFTMRSAEVTSDYLGSGAVIVKEVARRLV